MLQVRECSRKPNSVRAVRTNARQSFTVIVLRPDSRHLEFHLCQNALASKFHVDIGSIKASAFFDQWDAFHNALEGQITEKGLRWSGDSEAPFIYRIGTFTAAIIQDFVDQGRAPA